MTTYVFRCDDHGGFDVSAPMGRAGRHRPCPRCGGDAARVFLAPMQRRADPGVGAAIDRAERSRSEPEVVRSVPSAAPSTSAAPSGGGARATNPAWRRLPRP